MGADFICCALEIPRGETPNWKAAETFIKTLSADECAEAVCAAKQCEMEDLDDLLSPQSARDALLDALDRVKDFYNENLVSLSNTDILVVAGMSWGEPPDGFDEIYLFADSGAAHAAGFLDGRDWTVVGATEGEAFRFADHVRAESADEAERMVRATRDTGVLIGGVFPGRLQAADTDKTFAEE